ncbi:MAG: sulfotransferase [Steroidobacteraceae bacterium]
MNKKAQDVGSATPVDANRSSPSWQPPPRPEWVTRVNEEGACMDISGVVPLDERSLIASATAACGLTDFGAEDWREPFRVLLKALDEEAELNLMGRLRMRSELLLLLEARLRIEDTYKRHPEIEQEKIVEPIIIIGQGRSGTSFLQNVLAANPDSAGLSQWEAMFPCPPPEQATYKTDPRIAKADALIKQWNRVTPSMTAVHEFGGTVPIEDCEILSINFMSPSWFGCFAQVRSYDAYMASCDPMLVLRYHERVLKLLQWRNPREHWVLKEIPHLDRLEPLLRIYPDACFVWPHRDPVKALASGISAIGTLQWTGCDHVFKGGSLEWISNPFLSAARFNRVIDQIESGVVPRERIFHMLYRDLVRDPMATLEALYRHFGLRLSDVGRRGMAQYLADNPRDARPSHKVSMSAEDIARAREAYDRYQRYFDVPSEV